MGKKALLLMFVLSFSFVGIKAWAQCPPAPLASNPAPLKSRGTTKCIIGTNMMPSFFNKSIIKKVELKAGQSYWYTVTKCKLATSLYAAVEDENGETIIYSKGWVRDESGKLLKHITGEDIQFCFTVPKTGVYIIRYVVTDIIRGGVVLYTSSCLSLSNCIPEKTPF